MRKSHFAVAVLTLAVAGVVQAADWFTLKDFGPVTQRLAITLENPADVAVPAALVHLKLADLQKTLPDAKPGQVCVVDPKTKPARREAADLNFVPSQESDGMLIFSLPLKAHEKKEVYVYTAPQPLNMPGFPGLTQYDSRHAYRSFENRYAAFRMETGPGANTTGMAIDLFGKTRAGVGLQLQYLYGQGHDSYHKLSWWGVDILKVGTGPGDGGVYVVSGDKMARPNEVSTYVDCLYQGPVETKLRVSAPVEVEGKKVTVVRYLTLVGEDRSIRDEVTFQGDNLDGLQLGIGIRDLPQCVWVEKPEKGYAFQTGEHNQETYKAVGLGFSFDPSEYVRTVDISDKNNGGHIYILKPKSENGMLVSHHRIGDIWDMDGQLPKPVDTPEELRAPFESWLSSWAQNDQNPVKITPADKAESKP